MKFKSDTDKQLYILEAGGDSAKHEALFLKARSKMGSMFANFRKSKNTEREWARHRFKFMTAIKDFHDSPEGKKFHRQLDRFNLTHSTIPKGGMFSTSEECKAFVNYLNNELTFYLPLTEQVAYEFFVEELVDVNRTSI